MANIIVRVNNCEGDSSVKFFRLSDRVRLPAVVLPDMVWCEQNGNGVCPERGYTHSDDFESWFLGLGGV